MLLRDQAWLLLDAVAVICLAAPVPVPVPVAGCARQSEGSWEPGAFVLFIPNPNPGKSGEDSAWASRVRTPLEYSLTLSRPRRRSP